MDKLTKIHARNIIESVASSGQPPLYGVHYFTVGLEPYMNVIEREYLTDFVNLGGSAFKMVVGTYGGGKTHFMYSMRDLAWRNNYVVAYVSLNSKTSAFHRLDQVYKAIAQGLARPLSPDELLEGWDLGIGNFLRSEYMARLMAIKQTIKDDLKAKEALLMEIDSCIRTESISFGNALKKAFVALSHNDETAFDEISQWLLGEGFTLAHKRVGILEKIDQSTGFKMIRSLVRAVKDLGYNGLVILFDEAEQISSLSTRQKEQHLGNLREVIDACGQSHFKHVMMFYAVPDENFLDSGGNVYEALRQRVDTIFELPNPTGVKFYLENITSEPKPFLVELGNKLAKIYEIAFTHEFENERLSTTIDLTADYAYDKRYADIGYKRLFVERLIKALRWLHNTGEIPVMED